ncbi:hypothetical protein WUBG_13273 [Wuchereria bancrofti]|uniref:Solute carrier organic anion transporter family member n=1 Tax=Wuchereria bancrofti TaxID=6293 RepID=J9E0Z5_WUCBA|nr:hypothetical protein WUBG_13273 [Wuchereria bancrofti]
MAVIYSLIAGVLLSAVSMFVLALPVVLFGAESSDEVSLSHEHEYILRNICDPARVINGSEKNCELQEKEHFWAFCILIVGQILAGIAAAPFNTVAYVYVDNNLEDKTKSPFYLSLLSSMYAFAPAFGFALSAVITRLYTTIFDVPSSVAINNDEWIGAWWLGFVIFGLFYLAAIVPLLFFPKNLLKHNSSSFEMQQLRNKCSHDHDDHQLSFLGNEERSKETFCGQFKAAVTEFPGLIKNRVFISMIIGWMFGSYLTSGYCTYLPKYIETQFGHSASVADTYAGKLLLVRNHGVGMHEYILRNICDPARVINGSEKNCELQEKEHFWAFCILIVGQILAGIAAAPFNTVAYVYVDNNLEDKTKSPFYLSIFQYFSICWKQCYPFHEE